MAMESVSVGYVSDTGRPTISISVNDETTLVSTGQAKQIALGILSSCEKAELLQKSEVYFNVRYGKQESKKIIEHIAVGMNRDEI